MKILTLSIKQQNFDDILSGEKTQEEREVRPTTEKRYIRYVGDPEEPDVEIIQYDAIKFLTGAYEGVRPFAVVEVKDAEVIILTNEKGEELTYEVNGETYTEARIIYTLGKVLERSK